MSKVRIYQNGQQVTLGPVTAGQSKYKFVLDGKEYEFTDDELDKAWSDDALKSILREGGIREDDLNDRYSQLKDQAQKGKYSFDTTPSLTISGNYEGDPALLGTDKRIHAIDKIFGVHNKGKQMNTVNYYLPVALKKIVTERESLALKLLSDKENADKEKFGKDTENLYSAVSKGYGFGHLAYGEEYDLSIDDPNKMKTLLTPYWSMTELERRNILTKSGSGLQQLYNLKPEQLTLIEEKHPGFTKNREKIIKWYSSQNNQFDFSSLPTMNDLWNNYSNDLESMLQDAYLFDKSKWEGPQTPTPLEDGSTFPDYESPDTQHLTVTPKVPFYKQVADNATRIEIPEQRYLESSVLKQIFPKYNPSLGYWLAWHTKGKENGKDIYFAPLTNPDGSIRKSADGRQLIRVITYDKPTNQVTTSIVYDPDYFEKTFGNKIYSTNGPKEDIIEHISRLDSIAHASKHLSVSPEQRATTAAHQDFMKNGGTFVLKAQKGTVIQLRADKADEDRMNYIQKVLDKYQITPQEAAQKYQEWVGNGLIIEKQLNPIQKQQATTPIDYNTITPGANKAAATTWHSQTVGNIADKGIEGLSRVDWEDLTTLGLDLASLVPGPTGALAGILGGITGTVADIERDGFDWQDLAWGAFNTGIGALSFLPGVGLIKAARIAKYTPLLKKVVPVLHALFTGMSLVGASKILEKGMTEGFDNLSLEDMRMLGSAIVGLRNAKNILKKVMPYEKVSMGNERVLPVKFTKENGEVIRHQVVFNEAEVARIKSLELGKQNEIAKQIILEKIPKDINLSSRLGNTSIKPESIELQMTSAPRKGFAKLKMWGNENNQVDLQSEGIRIKAPIETTGSRWELFRNKFYTGDQNMLILRQRSNPERFQNIVHNKDVSANRLTQNETGEFVPERGTAEINAMSKRELAAKQLENDETLAKLQGLNKVKPLETTLKKDMPELSRKQEKNVFINSKDTENSKEAVNQLIKVNKELKGIKAKYLDPEMQGLMDKANKNLVDVIKAHKDKLVQIRLQAEANSKLIGNPRRIKLLERLKNSESASDNKILLGEGTKTLPKESLPKESLPKKTLPKKTLPKESLSKKKTSKETLSKEDILKAIKSLKETERKLKKGFKSKLNLSSLGLKRGGILKLQNGLVFGSIPSFTPTGMYQLSAEELLRKRMLELSNPTIPNPFGVTQQLPFAKSTPKVNLPTTKNQSWVPQMLPLTLKTGLKQPTIPTLQEQSKTLMDIPNYTIGKNGLESTSTENKGEQTNFDSNKAKRFQGLRIDPVLAGQFAQLINGILGAKNQKTNVSRTVLGQLQEILPTISGNLLLETNLNAVATQARNQNSLNTTADLGINALQNNALNSKIMSFLGQQGAQQTVALNQLRDKQTLAAAAYAQQRSDIANQNVINKANEENQEQANRNAILLNITDLTGKFLADRTQMAYGEKQEKEGFERQLSQYELQNDIEKAYKPKLDRLEELQLRAQQGQLKTGEDVEYKELKNWYQTISSKKNEILLRGLYSGQPYVSGDFEKLMNS